MEHLRDKDARERLKPDMIVLYQPQEWVMDEVGYPSRMELVMPYPVRVVSVGRLSAVVLMPGGGDVEVPAERLIAFDETQVRLI